jgi:transcription antitermination factor NusG
MQSTNQNTLPIWYVLHTKPRHEKKLSEQLKSMGIENYCPTYIKVSKWSDRTKKIETPLISSHLFVKIEEDKRSHVFVSPSALRYLFWNGNPAVVREKEIEQLKMVLTGKVFQSAELKNYHTGDNIEINAGPFTGQSGQVQAINKNSVTIVLKEMGAVLTLHA